MELSKEIIPYAWSTFGDKMICQLLVTVEEEEHLIEYKLMNRQVFEYFDDELYRRHQRADKIGSWLEWAISPLTEQSQNERQNSSRYRLQRGREVAQKTITVRQLIKGQAWHGDQFELDDYFERLAKAVERLDFQLKRAMGARQSGGTIYGIGDHQ